MFLVLIFRGAEKKSSIALKINFLIISGSRHIFFLKLTELTSFSHLINPFHFSFVLGSFLFLVPKTRKFQRKNNQTDFGLKEL